MSGHAPAPRTRFRKSARAGIRPLRHQATVAPDLRSYVYAGSTSRTAPSARAKPSVS